MLHAAISRAGGYSAPGFDCFRWEDGHKTVPRDQSDLIRIRETQCGQPEGGACTQQTWHLAEGRRTVVVVGERGAGIGPAAEVIVVRWVPVRPVWVCLQKR